MTLEQLRIFVAVAARQHMTRAAQDLHMTQSAVSGAIQSLEERHNVPLFSRVGRGIELTQAGKLFLPEARSVLRAAMAAELALREVEGLKRGFINIYASQTTGSYWLPERLTNFHNKYPNINLSLRIGNTEQVAAAVRSGEAEIGFVEGRFDGSDLVSNQVDVDELIIVVGASHPWRKLKRISSDHIAQTNWVLREPGSGTRWVFEQALRRLKFDPGRLAVVFELPSNEAVRVAVEAGAGATAISKSVVEASLRSKRLRKITFERLDRPFVRLQHKERHPSQAASALVAFLDKLFRSSPFGKA
jgi:DNA-binding transcriptional LysR family regulator